MASRSLRQSTEPPAAGVRNLSEEALNLIRDDIMSARLTPGTKLRLDTLAARYKIGAVPVREALNRLTSAGFVEYRSQRGFFVAGLSLDDLEELVKTRIWLETKALSESMRNTTPEWEERVVLAYYRLARTHRLLGDDDDPVLNREWETLHHDFHLTLLERCGSSWLLGFCSSMMDQSVRYRNLSVNLNRARRGDALPEHEALMKAVVEGKAATAIQCLETHYRRTLDGLRSLPL
ncbi:MAG: GntR family transcriptional regulator [Pseudomonadota bacterium]